jgi:hypothetical protein
MSCHVIYESTVFSIYLIYLYQRLTWTELVILDASSDSGGASGQSDSSGHGRHGKAIASLPRNTRLGHLSTCRFTASCDQYPILEILWTI